MPVAKTVTLAQAKAAQQTAAAKGNEPNATQKAPEKPTQPTTHNHIPEIREMVEPTEEQLEEEERKALAILEAQDEEDPDEKQARETRERIAAEKEAKKNEKRKPSTSRKSKGLQKRKCERCKNDIQPKDPRTRFCMPCANIVKKEKAQAGGGRPPADQDTYQEKLRPFLRLGLNLKEACLEAEVGYATVLEKTKTWV